MPKVTDAFRGDGGLSWGDHHQCLFSGTEWFFRTGYRAELPNWIAALDGVADTLASRRHGRGRGVRSRRFGGRARAAVPGRAHHGLRLPPAVDRAPRASAPTRRASATESRSTVADAKSYAGTFDLICFFDCLHDMGDPVGIARYAREHLNDGGTVLLVEPFAIDGRADNIDNNPMAAMLYTVSSSICTPNSLSQEVGLGLGAQAGEAQLRQVFEDAGFTQFRRAAETPLNLILEAKH